MSESTWRTVRAATGVMAGTPADAVEDTAALYDHSVGCASNGWSEAVYRDNLRTLIWVGLDPNVRRGCAIVRAMLESLRRIAALKRSSAQLSITVWSPIFRPTKRAFLHE